MPDHVTLDDIARAAGVSISTASRALSGRGDLAPQTRARVLRVSRDLGYARTVRGPGRPAAHARLLDLVLGRFHDPYSDEVTAGARTAAASLGFDLVLTAERENPDDDWPARIRSRGSAGVVLGLVVPTASQLSLLRDAGIPIVLLGPRSRDLHGLPRVETTDADGGAVAARHLIDAGADRFAVVVGTPAYRFGRARADGFVREVRARRPGAVVTTVTTPWSSAGVRDAVRGPLEAARGQRLGLFAVSDELAEGVYPAAAAAGVRIPDDVLVVGFDDLPRSRDLRPPLTSIHQPIREMAAAAVTMAARAAEGEPPAVRPLVLPTRLVVRGSARGLLPA